MILDLQAAQAAVESATQGAGGGIWLPAAVVVLVVTEVGRLGQSALKALAAKRNGSGGDAKANAGNVSVNVGGTTGNGSGDGKANGGARPMTQVEREMLMDHHREIGKHESEILNICTSFERYHTENRQDHERIFRALDDIRAGK